MKVLGMRKVAIARLNLPGDIVERVDSDDAARMAASFDSLAPLSEPICRKVGRGLKLLAGRTRVAAHIRLGHSEITVKVVQCTDTEARQIELTENGRRRHLEPASVAEINALIEKLTEQVIREGIEQPKRGIRLTPRAAAMRKAAELTGYSLSAIREFSRRAKDEGLPVPAEAPRARLMPIGMDLTSAFLERVAMVQNQLTKAASGVSTAMAQVGTMKGVEILPRRWFEAVLEKLLEASREIRYRYPTSLCPYCKGQESLQQQCAACEGCGWIGAGMIDGVPDKLWDSEERVVMRHGEPVRLEDL